jgi:hypothetical protein
MKGFLLALWRNVRGIMREIADENAYERHLEWHGTTHSPAEYRRFADGRLAAKYQRAKCC